MMELRQTRTVTPIVSLDGKGGTCILHILRTCTRAAVQQGTEFQRAVTPLMTAFALQLHYHGREQPQHYKPSPLRYFPTTKELPLQDCCSNPPSQPALLVAQRRAVVLRLRYIEFLCTLIYYRIPVLIFNPKPT